jgi:hypothetical protein
MVDTPVHINMFDAPMHIKLLYTPISYSVKNNIIFIYDDS